MIYQLIENLARMIMEWSMRRQKTKRHIVDEVRDVYSHRPLRKIK